MAAAKFQFTKKALENMVPTASRQYVRDAQESSLGAYLTPNGVTSFFAVLNVEGKTVRRPLGRFPALSIPLARKRARQMFVQYMASGVDPADRKRQVQREHSERVNLSDAVRTYLGVHDLKASTRRDYLAVLERFCPDWMHRDIRAITSDDVASRYVAHGQRAPSQADYAFRVLRAVFRFARVHYQAADGSGRPRVQVNPTDTVVDGRMRFKRGVRQRRLQKDDLPIWWNAVVGLDNPVVRDLFVFWLFTGIRREEGASLRWANVNARTRSVFLENPKNDRQIELPLPTTVVDLLAERQDQGEWVFPAPTGKGWLRNHRRARERVIRETGIAWSPHDLRRTFASLGESLDISRWVLKTLMNHTTDPADTTGLYVVPDLERLREASDRIESRVLSIARRKDQ